MKRKLPTKMKIGYRTYTIKRADPKEAEEANYLGVTIARYNEIRIRDDVSDEELKSTLFHEYFHAAMGDAGMNTGMSSAKEEQWCQFFSACIMELTRNPGNWKILEWTHNREKIKTPKFDVTRMK